MSFIDDQEKMIDFFKLTKEEFLNFYSYLTEEEYEATKQEVENMEIYKVNKENPIKIKFNYHARGFYCPTCSTGVKNKTQKCPFCSQQLLDAYGFDKTIKQEF